MRRTGLALAIVAAAGMTLLGGGAAAARPFCTDPPFIHFLPLTGSRGSASANLRYDIVPGDLACFKLSVPAARTLHVTLAAPRDKGSVRIYPQGWTITRDGRSFTFGVPALPGAGEEDDARAWTGPLPQAGPILIVVGMKPDGGRQYVLHVEVY